MVAQQHLSPGLQEMHLALQTQKFEQAYQSSLRTVSATQETEERRRLRVRLLLLEAENEDLHDQARFQQITIASLQVERDELLQQAHVASQSLEEAREDIRAKSRLVITLQREQDNSREKHSDASKVLAERLALSHELSALRPEVERLRAKLASNQNAISEKQNLQRQLRALEVELANEKRATQKARINNERGMKDEKQLQELRIGLEKEIEERRRIEVESQETASQLENQRDALESRLESLRAKLDKTKAQLADAQKQIKDKRPTVGPTRTENLESASEQELNLQAGTKLTSPHNKTKHLPKKRSHSEIELDASFGTPGNMPPVKRGKRSGSVQPGEKSSFSITPFLNRTGGPAPNSPDSSPLHVCEAMNGLHSSNVAATASLASSPKAKTTLGKARSNPLYKPPVGRSNSQSTAKRGTSKSLLAPRLEQVPEQEVSDIVEADPECSGQPQPVSTARNRAVDQPAAKRKRVFLGKTIFDDDNEDVSSRPQPVSSFPNRFGVGTMGRLQPKMSDIMMGGRSVPTFGGFSPLKKDRKLAAA